MTASRRGLRGLRTMGDLADQRRVRSPAAALLEMSVLANEKQRLSLEAIAIVRRQADIATRLEEIRVKEMRLLAFIGNPDLILPPTPEPTQGVKIHEFHY